MTNYNFNLYVIFYNIFIQLSLWQFSKLMINFRSRRQYSLHCPFKLSDVILHNLVFQPPLPVPPLPPTIPSSQGHPSVKGTSSLPGNRAIIPLTQFSPLTLQTGTTYHYPNVSVSLRPYLSPIPMPLSPSLSLALAPRFAPIPLSLRLSLTTDLPQPPLQLRASN